MDERPPEPPPLAAEQVEAVVRWLDGTANWLRNEQATASAHGHRLSDEDVARAEFYDDVALLFREAYDRL